MTNDDLPHTTKKTINEQHEPLYKLGMHPGAPEGLAIPAPLVTSFVLLLNDTKL